MLGNSTVGLPWLNGTMISQRVQTVPTKTRYQLPTVPLTRSGVCTLYKTRARVIPYVYCYFLPFSSSSIYYCFHFTLISTTYLQQCRSNRSEQPVPSFNCCGCGYTSKTDGVCSYYSHSVISVYASSFECKIFSRLWNWRRRFCLVETGNSCRYLYSLKVVRESTWEQ